MMNLSFFDFWILRPVFMYPQELLFKLKKNTHINKQATTTTKKTGKEQKKQKEIMSNPTRHYTYTMSLSGEFSRTPF